MPTSALSLATLLAESGMPATSIDPSWIASSLLMQRISVLLPPPLGPQMTSTSPAPTNRSTDLRTCSAPNHLLTPRSSIIDGLPPSRSSRSDGVCHCGQTRAFSSHLIQAAQQRDPPLDRKSTR